MNLNSSTEDPKDDPIQYLQPEPDVQFLIKSYEQSRSYLYDVYEQKQDDFDTRFNLWPGKSRDNRKHARAQTNVEPFPWDGASDQDVYLVDGIINSHIAMLMNAYNRSSFMATPTESNDIARASVVSNFVKWLLKAKIKEFNREIERGINHLLEKGVMVTYQYWLHKEQRVAEPISLQDLAEEQPEMVEMIASGEFDDEILELFQQVFEISKKKARTMLKELREEGMTIAGKNQVIESRPAIRTLAIDEDIYFAPSTIDPQDSPYIFIAVHYSAEQLRSKIETEGWNEEWVEYVIKNTKGQENDSNNTDYNRERHREQNLEYDLFEDNTYRVLHTFQRLFDDEGIAGIYHTVIHADVGNELDGELSKAYGISELMEDAHGKYPIIVTKLEEWSKRLYETRSYPEIGKSFQQINKAQLDAELDRLSLSTLPPLEYPVGRAPTAWGPGVKVPVRQRGEYGFAETPTFDPMNMKIVEYVENKLKDYFGVMHANADSIDIQQKQQHLINRFFGHLKGVVDQLFSLYQQYGPDEEWFRVNGVADVQKYDKGEPGERYDFYFSFDASSQDPAQIIERVNAAADLGGKLDRSGKLDTEKLLQLGVEWLLPGAGEQILLPENTATEKAVQEEREALTQVKNGFDLDVKEVDAHEIKLQIDAQWAQQPDIAQALEQDETFRGRFENYVQKRQFQVQQRQNAQIGRLGGTPSQFGQTPTA